MWFLSFSYSFYLYRSLLGSDGLPLRASPHLIGRLFIHMGTRMTNPIWIADVTLRAYNHWCSIHPTRQKAIINKYRERITHLYREDANEIPAFLGAD